MSDISTLPPRNQWVASGDTVARWRAEFDQLKVLPMNDGGCVLTVRLEGIERSLTLDSAARRHLAALLAG